MKCSRLRQENVTGQWKIKGNPAHLRTQLFKHLHRAVQRLQHLILDLSEVIGCRNGHVPALHTGLNLSSDLLGAIYNPYAAVPSLHFGYALLVGVALAVLAQRRWVRVVGALYPAFMLFDIVATGNHFLFDATIGGLVTVAGWWVARTLLAPAPARRRAVLHPVVA